MGKDDKKKKTRKALDSDSEDRKSKKHKEKKHKDKDSKEKDHKKEKRKDPGADAAEKRRVKEAKAFLKQRLKAEGTRKEKLDDSLPPPGFKVEPISRDDYFAKNPEFSAWLRDLQSVQFSDLSAEEARSRFTEFVELWNAVRLPARLYAGVDGGSLRRTQHSWGRLAAVPSEDVVRGMAAAAEEEREAAAAAATGRQVERRKWREDQTELLDQLLPPATAGTGEARVEARMARREEARARDGSPDTANLPGGGDAMGLGGDDSFAAAQQRQAAVGQRRQRFGGVKAAQAAQRAEEYGQKEDAAMAQFRALLDRGPIAIPKR